MMDWTIHLVYEFAQIRLDVSLRAMYGSAKVGIMAVARILVRERTPLGVGLVGGPRAEPPPDPENLQKLSKNIIRKLLKNALF